MIEPSVPPTAGTRAPTAARPRLPVPTKARWQPLRLGLVNLYRFDDEVFAFEDGRMLLRGNNGTGKSRVLALTLPFLFDGRIEPHRVEPDGDQAKRMEWNLLLGRHDDRLGYAWIELGRRGGEDPDEDEDGAGERFVTLGCGLRATAGRGAPKSWFFVTERRIGSDLELIAATGQALTRDRLAEAIGDRGQVVDTATEYRRLVDRTLFRLGEHRYEALVDLLIQLRRPQLSRQLDEALLSRALSEALPPLPPPVIADVADAFRALDDDRDALEGFRAALAATTTFLDAYRTYAAVAARRRATAVTRANSRYERTQGELRDAERSRDEAGNAVARLEARREELRGAERQAAVEVRTLEVSPEMEAARELDGARRRAGELTAAAAERAQDLERADAEVARRLADAEKAERAADETRSGVRAASEGAGAGARAAGLGAAHARALAGLTLPDAHDAPAVAAARESLDGTVDRLRRGAEHLIALDRDVRAALRELDGARSRLDERTAELDRARDAATDAEAALGSAREALLAQLRGWARELTVLARPPVDEISDRLETWQGAAPGPIAAAADRAATVARDRLSREAAELEAQMSAVEAERSEVAAEREAIAAGVHRAPQAPHTREPAAREGRAGAPLWRLVDLAGGVDAAAAAGYEAALEASGLLDAWVTPDGALLDDDDTVLVAAGTAPAGGGGLTAVLTPAAAPGEKEAAGVPLEHVAALLARIGTREEGAVWVAPDGRWRLGPLHGRWRKEAAEHIGHAARQRARQRRLVELDSALAELAARRAELDRGRAELESRVARAEEERARAPVEDAVREAVFAVGRAAAELRHHRSRVASAEAEVARRHQTLAQAETARSEAATDLGVPDRGAEPTQLLADVDTYRVALSELWATLSVHASSLARFEVATAEGERAAGERDRRAAQARAAEREAADAATQRDTLEETVGRTATEVMARLEGARSRRQTLAAQLEAAGEERERHLLERQAAATKAREAAERLEEQTAERAAQVRTLRRLVEVGFLRVAGIALDAEIPGGDAPWAADPAVRAARRVNDALGDVAAEDADWDRVQRGVHGHYTALEQALLPHALQPAATFDAELFVVTTTFQGRSSSIPELRELLAAEVDQRQSVLDAREREVLENHLVGEVATQLHDLIRRGEALVADMNQELAERPTSTGMRLRFSWRPDPGGPEALPDARRRLLAADHVWSPEDRQALGAFLQAQIRRVRDADDTGTWQGHLTRALDYRRWHLFAVERQQEGSWVRLTRRTHGTGSGGEKALALTVPQFAAAAAHYRSADPRAPRLIALDEAFVGIDSDMRAKCLDLLVQFDLDVVMTSEREWGCYPTVPAIAIYQLSTRPGIDAIGLHRWVWNGRDRVEVSDPVQVQASTEAPAETMGSV